jgi:hypothetical protein
MDCSVQQAHLLSEERVQNGGAARLAAKVRSVDLLAYAINNGEGNPLGHLREVEGQRVTLLYENGLRWHWLNLDPIVFKAHFDGCPGVKSGFPPDGRRDDDATCIVDGCSHSTSLMDPAVLPGSCLDPAYNRPV